MKNKVLICILLVQFIFIGAFVLYESITIKNAPELVVPMSITNFHYTDKNVRLHITGSNTIPPFENNFTSFKNYSYDSAYLVFDSKLNKEDFNEPLYISTTKPNNKPFIEVKVTIESNSKNFLDSYLSVYPLFNYALTSDECEKMAAIIKKYDDGSNATKDDVLLKAHIKLRNTSYNNSIFCESIEIDGTVF